MNAPAMDAERFKAAMRQQWDTAAAGWNAYAAQIRTWLAPVTQAMLDMAGVRAGQRVLDVAAGAGDQTLDIAQRVGPEGSVLATDISPAILALAQENAMRAGFRQIETRAVDGEALALEAQSFDAAVCRLGLMFFPDPLRGLREMHHALKPGARACALVFAGPERNPCTTRLMAIALRHAGVPPRDPFAPGGLLSLGKPGLIDALFREAGFHDVATTRMEAPFTMASAGDYLSFIRSSAGPVRQLVQTLSPAAAEAAWAEMAESLRIFETEAGWVGPNELLLTVGRR